ncbi:MAG: aldo/keto reductase [Dethiobacteria bacterium]|nr:aldo/keto reductase [Bacillota bacterium]
MLPKRLLGKTGFSVSIYSLGGESTIESTDRTDEAEAIINRALDLGVNYIDTAPAYNLGGSESNIGRVMKRRREEVFLATKTGSRSYSGTMRQVEKSLSRLQTDYLNLYQLHDMQTEDDLKKVLAEDGALKALEELKSQGVIRHTGITGHKDPKLLLRVIKEYPFDCILFSLNAGDVHYRSFKEIVLPVAVSQNLGIIAMKVTAVGRIFNKNGLATMEQALGYTLSHPVSTAIVGITNLAEVEENVRIAAEFKPYTEEELRKLERLTEPYAEEANFFKYHW